MTSLKVGEFALNKTDDNKTYCLRLHFFAGFDLDNEEEHVCLQPDIKSICKLIDDFLSNQFDGTTENSKINKCVHKARLLYVAAQYNGKIPTEAIVYCIDFALLPGRGLFVNWLATSSEAITEEQYGRDFYHLCHGGTWVGRNLGLFVLQVAHLATYSHLTFVNPILPNHIIAVQAYIQMGPRPHNFFMRNGYVSTEQTVERIPELDDIIYNGFAANYWGAEASKSNYLHIILTDDGGEALYILINTTGMIGERPCFNRRVDSDFQMLSGTLKDASKVSFPFAAKREHLMLLSSGLDFFFLLFSHDVDMTKLLHPSAEFSQNHTVSIKYADLASFKSKDS